MKMEMRLSLSSQGRLRQLCMIIGFMNQLNGSDEGKSLESIRGCITAHYTCSPCTRTSTEEALLE